MSRKSMPLLESLETRRMFSGNLHVVVAPDPVLENGHLYIRGTRGNDEIIVSLNTEVAGAMDVSVNGVVSSFFTQFVTDVFAHGGDGNDVVRVDEANGPVMLPMTFHGGGGGNDVIVGGSGNDQLFGDIGKDRITGGGGNDSISGGAGKDKCAGQDGNDNISGGGANDSLDGGSGNDQMSGGQGNDVMLGGEGDDKVCGGRGDDRIAGGAGADELTGGKGCDRFAFEAGELKDETKKESKIAQVEKELKKDEKKHDEEKKKDEKKNDAHESKTRDGEHHENTSGHEGVRK